MFESLGDALSSIISKVRNRGSITESDLKDVMRQIRISLLSADVSLPVVKSLTSRVHSEAIGKKVVDSVSPADVIVKIVEDEIAKVLGEEVEELSLSQGFAVILFVGLQGAGKTSSVAKLAKFLTEKKDKRVLMVSTDVYRPAAREQLRILGDSISIPTYSPPSDAPIEITRSAIDYARANHFDMLLLDTAGRTHIDDNMMSEIKELKSLCNPIETILVLDSLMGQDAVNIAKGFDDAVSITSSIVTRVDADMRGGAILSLREVTQKPIKFMSVGEKPQEFEPFHPERIASRILGMGDIKSLVERAYDGIGESEIDSLEERFESGKFDMQDLLGQIRNMKKLGGVSKLMSMVPGIGKMTRENSDTASEALKRQEAIICSMTRKERMRPEILNASRKKRIAIGSGTSVPEVNRLIKQHNSMYKMVKKVGKMDGDALANIKKVLSR